jgi:hypothetical protein
MQSTLFQAFQKPRISIIYARLNKDPGKSVIRVTFRPKAANPGFFGYLLREVIIGPLRRDQRERLFSRAGAWPTASLPRRPCQEC